MVNVSVKLDTRKLDHLLANIKPRTEKALTQAATEIQASAAQNTVRVDTGAMKAGWRVNPPDAVVVGVPSAQASQPEIFNTQHYALYNELGTSRMSASPMLVPAMEGYRRKIESAWKVLFEE
jgi:HK97 gp10 family phage protein